MSNMSSEHTGDWYAQDQEADAPLQQCQRGRNAGVLRAGERWRRTEQAAVQTTAAPGQSPGLPPIWVFQSGEEPAGLWVRTVCVCVCLRRGWCFNSGSGISFKSTNWKMQMCLPQCSGMRCKRTTPYQKQLSALHFLTKWITMKKIENKYLPFNWIGIGKIIYF